MKHITLLAVAASLNISAVVGADAPSQVDIPPQWSVGEIGPDSRVWKNEITVMTDQGPVVQTRSIVELATGLHYWDAQNNQWAESADGFELAPDGGAQALRGRYQVRCAPNANTPGGISITTPSGAVIGTHIAAIALADLATGNSVLVGQIRDSGGFLVPPNNEVVYFDAFDGGISADLRLRYRKGVWEQDVVITGRGANFNPADLGLNEETTVMQIWTEVLGAIEPTPVLSVAVDGLRDDRFDLGGMCFGRGYVYRSDNAEARSRGPGIAKTWVREDNRSFIVESLRWAAVQQILATLPPRQAAVHNPRIDRNAFVRALPRIPARQPSGERIQMAQLKASENPFKPAVVWDYTAFPAGNQTNYTFRADTTYLISGYANFWKTTTFEGGCVIKLVATNSAIVETWSNVVFKSSPYRPVIFTSRNDRSVGEDTYLAGAATNYFEALATSVTTLEVKNIKISYADTGLHTYGVNLHDAQFAHCGYALFLEDQPSDVNNVLIYDSTTAFGGGHGAKITARQITVDKCTWLTSDWYATNSVTGWVVFTNSLFSQVTSNGVVPTTNWFSATDDSGTVYQKVGAGLHYLADDSPYKQGGTSDIPDWLATNLTHCSTAPPMVWIDAITNEMTFEPVVARCDDVPDLGYYYPAADYLLTAIAITNSALTIMPSTVIAIYGTNGFKLNGSGATLASQGWPIERNHFVPFYAIQEESSNLLGGTLISSNTVVASSGSSTLQLNFTDFDGIANFGRHIAALASGGSILQMAVKDCSFNSGFLDIDGIDGAFSVPRDYHGFTNNIFFRVNATFSGRSVLNFWNNYAFGSPSFKFLPGGVQNWYVRDNFFHDGVYTNTRPGDGTWNIGWNAYMDVPAGSRLNLFQVNTDVLMGNQFYFTNGPLGEFYFNNTTLADQGSRRATNAGLYWYTTQLDQTKETGSMVDIGFHYPAVNSDGTYIDNDDDGLPSVIEDANGNGVFDSATEDDWSNPDTMNMGTKDNQLVFSFELQTTSDSNARPLGNIISNKAFRVVGQNDVSNHPFGNLLFLFDRRHQGLALNEWSPSGEAGQWAMQFDLGSTNGIPGSWYANLVSGHWYQFIVCYDLRNLSLMVSDVTSGPSFLVYSNTIWRDNMTQKLGIGGPSKALWNNGATYLRNVPKKAAMVPKGSPSDSLRYVWQGAIGNNSSDPSGPRVHGSWWPMLKMVSKGKIIISTGGYTESLWELQKYSTDKPNAIVTNFSHTDNRQIGGTWPVDIALPSTNTLYMKDSHGVVFKFDLSNLTHTVVDASEFPAPLTVQVPLANSGTYAVHPDDSSIAAVYYTNTEQVVVYNHADSSTNWSTNFVIGVANGYSNGPAIIAPNAVGSFFNNGGFYTNVKLCSYYFDADGNQVPDHRISIPMLCFQSDGKLWVSDVATSRVLRFDTNRKCDAWIMFIAHTYAACVDPNDSAHAFMGYLEFKVDYTGALRNSWTLVNYWGRFNDSVPGRPEMERGPFQENGLFNVTTINSRRYALVRDLSGNTKRVVELVANEGIRWTNTAPSSLSPIYQMEADGRILYALTNANVGTIKRRVQTATNNGDFTFSDDATDQTLSSAGYTINLHPMSPTVVVKTNGNRFYTYFSDRDYLTLKTNETNTLYYQFTGFHAGCVTNASGTTGAWRWTNGPTGYLNGKGLFATNCEHAGGTMLLAGTNLFCVFVGEQWTGPHGSDDLAQANQIMHFSTNGTFVGEFGLPRIVGSIDHYPGAAGNIYGASAVKVGNFIYLYTNDEWSHGLHRWKIRAR